MQGELAGLKTEDLRTLKRFLNSRAIAEHGQMIMHSGLLLQLVDELGSKLGVIHWELPAKVKQGLVNLWTMMKASASPCSHQFFWQVERTKRFLRSLFRCSSSIESFASDPRPHYHHHHHHYRLRSHLESPSPALHSSCSI